MPIPIERQWQGNQRVLGMSFHLSQVRLKLKASKPMIARHYYKLITEPKSRAVNHWKEEILAWTTEVVRYMVNIKTRKILSDTEIETWWSSMITDIQVMLATAHPDPMIHKDQDPSKLDRLDDDFVNMVHDAHKISDKFFYQIVKEFVHRSFKAINV